MTIQDKFSTIPDNAQVSVLWSKGAAEFICDAGQIKRAMECEEYGGFFIGFATVCFVSALVVVDQPLWALWSRWLVVTFFVGAGCWFIVMASTNAVRALMRIKTK